MGIPKNLVRMFILVVIALVLSLAGCRKTTESPAPAAKGPTHAEDIAAIKAGPEQWMTAFNAYDAAAVAATWADDAITMGEDEPEIAGKQAYKDAIQKAFDEAAKEYSAFSQKIVQEEQEVAGDWGYARGTWAWTGTAKAGGKSTQVFGKWLSILKRQPDGSWKMYRHCWNRDKPLPSTAK